jgi:hypothetical protein
MNCEMPCKGCPERHPACHDNCEKYKTAKAAIRARKRPTVLAGSPEEAVYAYFAAKKDDPAKVTSPCEVEGIAMPTTIPHKYSICGSEKQ